MTQPITLPLLEQNPRTLPNRTPDHPHAHRCVFKALESQTLVAIGLQGTETELQHATQFHTFLLVRHKHKITRLDDHNLMDALPVSHHGGVLQALLALARVQDEQRQKDHHDPNLKGWEGFGLPAALRLRHESALTRLKNRIADTRWTLLLGNGWTQGWMPCAQIDTLAHLSGETPKGWETLLKSGTIGWAKIHTDDSAHARLRKTQTLKTLSEARAACMPPNTPLAQPSCWTWIPSPTLF